MTMTCADDGIMVTGFWDKRKGIPDPEVYEIDERGVYVRKDRGVQRFRVPFGTRSEACAKFNRTNSEPVNVYRE